MCIRDRDYRSALHRYGYTLVYNATVEALATLTGVETMRQGKIDTEPFKDAIEKNNSEIARLFALAHREDLSELSEFIVKTFQHVPEEDLELSPAHADAIKELVRDLNFFTQSITNIMNALYEEPDHE